MDSPSGGNASPLLRARWFDGRSSQAQSVLISFMATPKGQPGPDVLLHRLQKNESAPQRIPCKEVAWPETWSANRIPRTMAVDLGRHGSLEVTDVVLWHTHLEAVGGRPALAQRMQTRWTVLGAVFLVAAVGLWIFYRFGTPWLAAQLTRYVPITWEVDVADQALKELDSTYLKPSTLPADRQATLQQRFAELTHNVQPNMVRYPSYAPRFKLVFRSGMPANAFALPGGTLVMTDSLVNRASAEGLDDDALLGVLGHEIGHVLHRHTTRMVVEQGVLNVGLGLALGDVSSMVSTGSSVLTGLAYRRQHETESDCFAIALMHQAHLPLAPMAQLLTAISHSDPSGKSKDAATSGKNSADKSSTDLWLNLLSSHPDTADRARQLQSGEVNCHDPSAPRPGS